MNMDTANLADKREGLDEACGPDNGVHMGWFGVTCKPDPHRTPGLDTGGFPDFVPSISSNSFYKYL